MKVLALLGVLVLVSPVLAQDKTDEHQTECVSLLEESLDSAEEAIERLRKLGKSGKLRCRDLEKIYELQKESNDFALKARAVCTRLIEAESCDAACYDRRLAPIKKLRDQACSR